MIDKKFLPMLAVDATDHLDQIKYPKMTSYKLDGIRCLFHPELGMVARSFKPIRNKQLQKKFFPLTLIAKELNRVFDGEIYAHHRTFQEITRACMTQDFSDENTQKKLIKELKFRADINYISYCQNLLRDMKFYCFETYHNDQEIFKYKQDIINSPRLMNDSYIPVKQTVVNSKDDIHRVFDIAITNGYEGLILRDPNSPYKFGRSTLKEEFMLKVKPFKTFDAAIVEVIQGTEVDPEAEKKINELGRSVTSRKKGDRILVNKAAAFLVNYGEHQVKVTIAMTDEEKKTVWTNRKLYVGRMIEYKGMTIGMKDTPRHPIFIRFRKDRD